MSRRLALTAVVAVLVLARPAAEAAVGGATMDWGVSPGWEFQTGRFNSAAKGYPCTVQVKGWARELGTSGVQRIRIHYEVYGVYAPIRGSAERSSTEVAYPIQKGGQFPDDFRSYYLEALMPWGLWSAANGKKLVMDYVGERPSFWKPDVHEEVLMGRFNCPLEPPPEDEPEGVEPGDVSGRGGAPGVKDHDQDGVEDCPYGSYEASRDEYGNVVCYSIGEM